MGEFQTRKYLTEEDRLAAKRASNRASRERNRLHDIERKRKARNASIRGPYHTLAEEEAERPPPEVLEAQSRRLSRLERWLWQATPTQWFIGEGPRWFTRTDVAGLMG